MESDADEDVAASGRGAPAEADTYLAPVEVEAHLKLLWRYNADILDFIWSRAVNFGLPAIVPNKDGWKLFFLRVILVPPNRFRPAAKVCIAIMSTSMPVGRVECFLLFSL